MNKVAISGTVTTVGKETYTFTPYVLAWNLTISVLNTNQIKSIRILTIYMTLIVIPAFYTQDSIPYTCNSTIIKRVKQPHLPSSMTATTDTI